MRSKFENGKKIRFASTLKKVELYSTCLELYLKIRNETEFRNYMQSFFSDDTIQIILDQIHNQLRTFAMIAIVEEEADQVKHIDDKKLEKKTKQSKDNKTRQLVKVRKFQEEQAELRSVYEKVNTLLSPRRQQFAELYFASTSNRELVKKAQAEMGITAQNVSAYKNPLLKELRECRDHDDKWLAEKLKQKNASAQEREELKPIYEKVKPLLSPKQQQFAELYFSSTSNQELTKKAREEMGIAAKNISAYKNPLLKELRKCRDYYEEWVEEKTRKKERILTKSCNSEDFLQTQEQLRPVYEKVKTLLSPKQQQFAEIYFASKTNGELMEKAVEQMHIAPQSVYGTKSKLLDTLKSCLNNDEAWMKRRQSRNKKETTKDRIVLQQRKTKVEYENLYYLYQPYIPLEYQREFESWLNQDTEFVSKQCTIVMQYLSCCDAAMQRRQSLPNFEEWFMDQQKKPRQKKDITMEFLHSISREEIMTLLSQLPSVPQLPRYQRLYEFYGIHTTRHSVEQLCEKYPKLSLSSIKSEMKRTVISIQKQTSEILKERDTWERERQELLPKFTFSSFELGKLEAICVNYYYGFTVAPMTISEIAEKVHFKEWKVEKFIQSAKLILKQSKVAKNPAILASVEKISNVNEDNISQLQDKDFRALRLMVQQALTTDEMKLNFVQEKILNLFFGFPNKPIKSSREIAELCGCTEQDARTYLIETIRYVLNYISKEDFETKFEGKKVVKQLSSIFNK